MFLHIFMFIFEYNIYIYIHIYLYFHVYIYIFIITVIELDVMRNIASLRVQALVILIVLTVGMNTKCRDLCRWFGCQWRLPGGGQVARPQRNPADLN